MKQHTRNAELCKKLDYVLELFEHTDDPRRVGDRKAGQFNNLHAVRLSKQYRLLYEVADEKREITLLKIGDHKQVYGHD